MKRLTVLIVVGQLTGSCGSRPVTIEATRETLGLCGIVAGPVAGATVHVFRLQAGSPTADLGSGTTAADGSFRVGLGLVQGPFVIVATGGSFIDPATGAPVGLNTDELSALVPTLGAGALARRACQ